MSKGNLFLDFDGVLCQSTHSFSKVYSDRYHNHPLYIKPNPLLVKKWDLSDQHPLLQKDEVMDIFGSKDFFNYLKPFPDATKTLEELKDNYNMTIISIGTHKNISLKTMYVQDTFPFIENYIGIVNKGVVMNKALIKGLINHDDGVKNIFIDDNESNLYSVQDMELIRYLYGASRTEYNGKWIDEKGRWLKDWKEVGIYLRHALKYQN